MRRRFRITLIAINSSRPLRFWGVLCLSGLISLFKPLMGHAQEPPKTSEEPSIQTDIQAGDEDDPRAKRKFTKWNSFDGPFSSLKYGGGFLVDYAAYSQDAESKSQVRLMPE